MTSVLVGDRYSISDRLLVDSTEITTGTMTLRLWRDNAGSIEDLQADETSWSTTNHSFAMVHGADTGWLYSLTAPASGDGFWVSWEATHSVYGKVASGQFKIVTAESDDGPEIRLR